MKDKKNDNEIKFVGEFDRKQGIGGSDATKLYNGEWHTLWLEKTGDAEPVDLSDVLPVQMGVHTEPFNIQWFEKQTGLKVTLVINLLVKLSIANFFLSSIKHIALLISFLLS